MALHLAALLADETTAQAIQLYTEYDPQPPFDSGSMVKGGPCGTGASIRISPCSLSLSHNAAGGGTDSSATLLRTCSALSAPTTVAVTAGGAAANASAAAVSKISEDQLFYLMSRGMTEDEAMAMIVRGFVEPIARELPMEYALELNRLIELQMEGAVG